MKKLYACLSIVMLVITASTAFSQTQTKFDYYLAYKQQSLAAGRINGSELIPVFVKGNISEIKKLVESKGGVFKYSYSNIAAIQIPVGALPSFMESTAVLRMEGQPTHMKVMNDSMRIKNHMVEVQMGQFPLTQSYNGKGIVLGFIDTGIDFLHPDFQDTTNSTRIKFLWDQNRPVASNTPLPYGYGQEWTQAQMDTAMSQNDVPTIDSIEINSEILWGHGSSVAGVGCSNGRANGLSIGADPKSDIIMVAYNFYSNNPNLMTDAVKYIYDKANLLGEPCVINASLGDYTGSHDGKDLQAQMIDAMITAQPGRAFVAAAGNSGYITYHVGYSSVAGDTGFTWFPCYGGPIDLQLYADTGNFRNMQFAIGVDQSSPSYLFRKRTNFSTIFPYLGHLGVDTLKNQNGQRLGYVSYYGQLTGGTYSLEAVIYPDSTSYYWRFITTGTGKFDCWSFLNGSPAGGVLSGLPSQAMFPDIKNYKKPDSNQTLCSSFQCSPHVITVGNYWNRSGIIDYDTVFAPIAGYQKCMITDGTSLGPTRDGRIKPDVAAPGCGILSCLPTFFRNYDIGNNVNFTTIDVGAWHAVDGGTSSASPQVAGAAGMLFGLYPNATEDEIRNMIIYCADEDACTGFSLPDNTWGYGKLDAFKSMTGCALGYAGIPNVPASTLSVYPNPMRESGQISYDFTSIADFCTANITLYDIMGKGVKSIELKKSKGTLDLNKGSLAAGTYFYSLQVDGTRLRTEKLVVL